MIWKGTVLSLLVVASASFANAEEFVSLNSLLLKVPKAQLESGVAPTVEEVDGSLMVVTPTDDGWKVALTFEGKSARLLSVSWPPEVQIPSFRVRVPYAWREKTLSIPVRDTKLDGIETDYDAVMRLDQFSPVDLPPAEILPYLWKVQVVARSRSERFSMDLEDVPGATLISVYLYAAATIRAVKEFSIVPDDDIETAIGWLIANADGTGSGPALPADFRDLQKNLDESNALFVKAVYNVVIKEPCDTRIPGLEALASAMIGLRGTEVLRIGETHLANARSKCDAVSIEEASADPLAAVLKARAAVARLEIALDTDPYANGTIGRGTRASSEPARARRSIEYFGKLF